MVWLAVDEYGFETISNVKPRREKFENIWIVNDYDSHGDEHIIELPQGSIEKLIGRKLTWEDEPVEI